MGCSEGFDAVEAFSEASLDAARKLDGPCDLCLLFAGAPHLGHGKWILSTVHEHLEPRHLIGCGAGGVVGAGREIEEGPAAVVWAASMPGAEVSTHHFEVEQADAGGHAVLGVPDADELGQTMILLADPYSFATEALLDRLDELRPGMPVLGGLASASAAGSASLFRNGDVLTGGAVACSLSGRADPALRVSGRRPGRPGDDDHRRGAQRDRGAGLEAGDRAASRGARRA